VEVSSDPQGVGASPGPPEADVGWMMQHRKMAAHSKLDWADQDKAEPALPSPARARLGCGDKPSWTSYGEDTGSRHIRKH